jgi:hypothetical protein
MKEFKSLTDILYVLALILSAASSAETYCLKTNFVFMSESL